MASSESSASKATLSKRNIKVLTLADKLKILNFIDSGEKIATIARRFNVNESTVRTVRKFGKARQIWEGTLNLQKSSVQILL